MTSRELSDEIVRWVSAETRASVDRYLPGWKIPGYFGGQRIAQDYAVDLCVVLSMLEGETQALRLGTGQAETCTPFSWRRDGLREILRQIDGAPIQTFYSYRLGEVLLRFGEFAGNPILEGLETKQIESLKQATDSTSIYKPERGDLGGYPNNYWCVLARCEHTRKKLGILPDEGIYQLSLGKVRELFLKNRLGFFDDDNQGQARYDIYSCEVMLFVEPMWEILGWEMMRRLISTHVKLVETIAMENGGCVMWGRSIGALSICMNAEMCAVGARFELGHRGRLLNLVRHSFEKYRKEWVKDHLSSAHRGRMTDGYRGPHRLLQLTYDSMLKWLWVAKQLREIDAEIPEMKWAELFPERDEWVPFDDRGAGMWMYRKGNVAWQVPVVSGYNADYAASLHGAGLFENAVDSGAYSGVPRMSVEGKEYSAVGLGKEVKHGIGELTILGQAIKAVGPGNDGKVIGERNVSWRAKGRVVEIDEAWGIAKPQAAGWAVAEAGRVLDVDFTSDDELTSRVVEVAGMHGSTTAWSTLHRMHEVDFTSAEKLKLHARIAPAIRVMEGPATHDYNRALYAPAAKNLLQIDGFENGFPVDRLEEFLDRIERADVFHVGWPEHLLNGPDVLKAHEKVCSKLKKSAAKVVWTLHNRRPHTWKEEDGRRLYEMWSGVTSVALHHSRWGESIMRREYPALVHARHVYLPHGHYGEAMKVASSREELEAKYGLKPCGIRFGILGRYQPEKQIEMMLEAFVKAGREDQQLILTAYDDKTVIPKSNRIIKLPRGNWMTRQEIAEHNALCDALLAAQVGTTYLTSGTVADAVGLGLAMIVPEWEFYREILGEAGIYHGNTVQSLSEELMDIGVTEIENCRKASRALQGEYDFRKLNARLIHSFESALLDEV